MCLVLSLNRKQISNCSLENDIHYWQVYSLFSVYAFHLNTKMNFEKEWKHKHKKNKNKIKAKRRANKPPIPRHPCIHG